MSARVIMDELRQRGATIRVVGDRLVVEGPRGALTTELRAALATNREAVMAMLRSAERQRLGVDECMVIVDEVVAGIAAAYEPGTLTLLEHDARLAEQLQATETAIDQAAERGPTEAELRAALVAHRDLIVTTSRRLREARLRKKLG